MGDQTVFEIYHESGDAFRAHAELYTPNGYFVKSADAPLPDVVDASGQALRIGGMIMSGNLFQNMRIGVWIRSNGSLAIGVA
jgi:hypothetical protein